MAGQGRRIAPRRRGQHLTRAAGEEHQRRAAGIDVDRHLTTLDSQGATEIFCAFVDQDGEVARRPAQDPRSQSTAS